MKVTTLISIVVIYGAFSTSVLGRPPDAMKGECNEPTVTQVCNGDADPSCLNYCKDINGDGHKNVECKGSDTDKQCWYWTHTRYASYVKYYMQDKDGNYVSNYSNCDTCSNVELTSGYISRTCIDAELGSDDCEDSGSP